MLENQDYPVAMQGAGRVQVFESLNADVVTFPAAISLGIHQVQKSKKIWKQFTVKNLDSNERNFTLSFQSKNLKAQIPESFTLKAGEEKTFDSFFLLSQTTKTNDEVSGFIQILENEKVLSRVPVLAVLTNLTKTKVSELNIHASSLDDSPGALVEMKMKNSGTNESSSLRFQSYRL